MASHVEAERRLLVGAWASGLSRIEEGTEIGVGAAAAVAAVGARPVEICTAAILKVDACHKSVCM